MQTFLGEINLPHVFYNKFHTLAEEVIITANIDYPSEAPKFTLRVFWWGPCCSSFYASVFSINVSLRSLFRAVLSATISA
jgi:hypothetical protein